MSSISPASVVPPKTLSDYRSDRFSQSGEDGIIARILEILPELNRWCVEFGAWNGVVFSNSRRLILEENYSAVLIEGDAAKFKELKDNYTANPKVVALNAMVGWDPPENLDSLLSNTSIPLDFDVLIVDIDGNDYHVWAAVERYRPKLVVIEVNATIPNEVSYVQSQDPEAKAGCSLRSVIELGRKKGYEPVAYSGVNVYFVRGEDFPLFGVPAQEPEDLRPVSEYVTHVFFDYRGRAILAGNKKVVFHNVPFDESRIRQIPRYFQDFPSDYGRLKTFLFWVYTKFRYPRLSLLGLRKKLTLRYWRGH